MATYTLSPFTRKQYLDDSGNPLSSGTIYTYAAGTTTALTTYKTSSGTAWGAYVQLDSAGRPENGEIYLQAGQSYKFIAFDSSGVQQWSQDNIGAVPPSSVNVDISGTAGENLTAGELCYIGSGGAWFKADADAASSSTDVVLGFCVTSVSTGDTTTFRTDGQIELAGPLTAASIYYVSGTAGAITTTAPSANYRVVGQAQSTTRLALALNPPARATINFYADPKIKDICDGRLTLTSGTPVTTGDVTAATTIYFALYRGNQIGLYTGSVWTAYTFAQLSIAVPATTSTLYDVFVDYNDGTPQLALTAWTNDTTRATALTTQDGVYVKTGDTQQRYVGSVRTTGVSGQTEDSLAKRYVWNYYNRVPREMRVVEATNTWTYTTAAYQQANASAANQLDCVLGAAEEMLVADVVAVGASDQAANTVLLSVAIGEDSATTPKTGCLYGNPTNPAANTRIMLTASLKTYPAVGRHYYTWLEYSTAVGTTTWQGDGGGTLVQTGIQGWIRG